MKRLVIAGGGTGGHLYPGIAVAQYLKDKDVECFFIVSDRGLERKVLSGLGYGFYEQKETPLKGVSLGTRVKSLFRLLGEIKKCFSLIKKGDTVLLTGGFASAAAAFVAVVKRNRLYIHEQNSVMGLTNRIFAGFCDKVFLSFPETANAAGNTVVAGNPVRAEFKNIKPLEKGGKRILVMGGSQGSRLVNNLVAGAAGALLDKGYAIYHQAGGKLLDETKKKYIEFGLMDHENLTLAGYIDNVAEALENCDIVIARSGSGTVFEVTNAGRYAIYVPFKAAADNHQFYNALYAEKQKGAKVIAEDSANIGKLLEAIEDYENNCDLYIESVKNMKKYESAVIMAGGMNIG
ncbi:UDP-N-acetylglucosamine--N-acetylmuramyl-(pentapeptide) pyrophosphoryl-undecaprenol N-acetylglucosamine transferase [Seleniivibrio woodruffii]|uniref:UDP-N-acetylglucosamine--N-acetylmuramyl-(pentapeptide) pyrophosphoryl-undecaprenol N-acetylglucosamine transferase n=1 Tax=Seleniivibrio woodruffii TaxID=1078050 RepID=A0A4V2PRC1_9BACT|nr:UDP-N-acetylglucosamine--N-acetylmuramyl-(pentapeptide) pyrophosphoryl-undecaprenol N-acetylglucosamine transferase [Seleniivibrio woodruffii]TCK58221.1 UDP-N-acetylglucosamine-N-acetylmuramylpentapeptide N-acetylglucosamine transferase [Seleniivibrio woodruffii]TVZ35686.1 UDP-N-acetylglucosamine-N-acetylmuramylpentapeptide N-acetylglucosamine transferase [Seleniivibrio woodruffii]